MSIFDRFSRLEQGKSPLPRANIMRQYQTPQGIIPPMALPRPSPPQSEMTKYQQNLTPMGRRILEGLAAKRESEGEASTPAAGQVSLSGQPKGTDSFMSRLMTPQSQGMLSAAAAGLEASGWQDRPVSLGQVLGRMGTAGIEAYGAAQDRQEAAEERKLSNLLKQAKIGTELAKGSQAFSGTSMTSQSFNTLLKIGPKIKAGTATEPEMARYDLAFGYLAKPKQQKTYDDLGNETITTIPAQDLSQFPLPRGGAGTVGKETTKPSTEAIKSDKFVKSMDSMALNVNAYRQALAKLDRLDMLSGAAEVPTDAMANAASIAESLRLNLKELYELGALVGGDFQILDNLLTSPNSAKAAKMGGTALSIQLDQLEKILGQKLAEKDATLSGTYSTPIPVSTPEEWAKVKIGQYGRLPNGQIKMKVQTQ